MKALLAEYTVFNDPDLASEGEAMLQVLRESFERCGHEVLTPAGKDFEAEIRALAPLCDVGLVIAPDHLLPRYTKIIEDHTHNLGCGSMNAALCANKQRTAGVLASHGIAVPREVEEGERVIKEISGCATQNMHLSSEPPGAGEFGQEYIEGDHLSVSLVLGRVVGETCLYFSGKGPLTLALNRQYIELQNGCFRFLGGETPAVHPRKDEIIETAKKAATVLGCQGHVGVDMVVGEEIYVVDVNPRITSSLVGISAIMEEEIADILVRSSYGDVPDCVHLNGRVTFDTHGQVRLL
jgi:predicted ATP-grasp superfamily ATP-dependent carboligase